MSKYFATPRGFSFPDEIFPACTAQGVPRAPLELENELAAQLGQPSTEQLVLWAQRVLHQSELYGVLSRDCVARAIDAVEQAAAANGLASYLLGNWCLFGLFGRKRDRHAAKAHYKTAIKLKNARGWYRMGVSAEEKRDWDVAANRYESGASLKDAACLYRLAVALLKGQLGYKQDVDRAVSLFEMACQRADEDFPQPLYLVGLLYLGELESNMVPQNRELGFQHLKAAARFHFAPALVRMANAYLQNELDYDYGIILRYLHCASRQERRAVYLNRSPSFSGNVEAQLTKVLLCGSPPQYAPNEEWAYKFAVASADLGNSIAQFALGYFAEVGIYVPVNLEFAMEMYKRSGANNCDAAKQRLEQLRGGEGEGEGGLKRSNSLTRRDHDVAVKRQLSNKSKDRAETIVKDMMRGERVSEAPDKAPEKTPYPSDPPPAPYPDSPSENTLPVKATPYPDAPIGPPATRRTPSPEAKAPYPNTPMTRARVASGPVRSSIAGYPITPVGHSRSHSTSPEPLQAKKLSYPTSPLKQEIQVPSPGQAWSGSASPESRELSLEPSVSPTGTSGNGTPGTPGTPGSPSGRRSPRALLSKFRSKFGSMSSSDMNFVNLPPPKEPAPMMRPQTFDQLPPRDPEMRRKQTSNSETTRPSLPRVSTATATAAASESSPSASLQPSPMESPARSRTPSPHRPVAFPLSEDTPTHLKRTSAVSVRKPRHAHTRSSVVDPSASASASAAAQRRAVSSPLQPVPEPARYTSFDQMGIKTVAEDKAGPCVIA